MSIDAKHAYRFGFLKSEKWDAIRLKALRAVKCKCVVCKKEDFFNDCHHIIYPAKWQKTRTCDLRVLCRQCHKAVHLRQKLNPEIPAKLIVKVLRRERQQLLCVGYRWARYGKFTSESQSIDRGRFFETIHKMNKRFRLVRKILTN